MEPQTPTLTGANPENYLKTIDAKAAEIISTQNEVECLLDMNHGKAAKELARAMVATVMEIHIVREGVSPSDAFNMALHAARQAFNIALDYTDPPFPMEDDIEAGSK